MITAGGWKPGPDTAALLPCTSGRFQPLLLVCISTELFLLLMVKENAFSSSGHRAFLAPTLPYLTSLGGAVCPAGLQAGCGAELTDSHSYVRMTELWCAHLDECLLRTVLCFSSPSLQPICCCSSAFWSRFAARR